MWFESSPLPVRGIEDGWPLPPVNAKTKQEATDSDEDSWDLVEPEEDDAKTVVEYKCHIPPPSGPSSGITFAVPRLISDLEALAHLTASEKTTTQVVRGKVVLTALYGFGDASSGGFGSTIEQVNGVHSRFGLWARDEELASSNY